MDPRGRRFSLPAPPAGRGGRLTPAPRVAHLEAAGDVPPPGRAATTASDDAAERPAGSLARDQRSLDQRGGPTAQPGSSRSAEKPRGRQRWGAGVLRLTDCDGDTIPKGEDYDLVLEITTRREREALVGLTVPTEGHTPGLGSPISRDLPAPNTCPSSHLNRMMLPRPTLLLARWLRLLSHLSSAPAREEGLAGAGGGAGASIRAAGWAAGSGKAREATLTRGSGSHSGPNQVSAQHGPGAKGGKARSKGRGDPCHKQPSRPQPLPAGA